MAFAVAWIVCPLLASVTCSSPLSRRVNQSWERRWGNFVWTFESCSLDIIIDIRSPLAPGYARRCHSTTQALPQEGWRVHILRGQCRRDCEQQGRNEGISNHRTCGKGVRRSLAENCIERRLCRINHASLACIQTTLNDGLKVETWNKHLKNCEIPSKKSKNVCSFYCVLFSFSLHLIVYHNMCTRETSTGEQRSFHTATRASSEIIHKIFIFPIETR